jgi:hypothetical protein
MYAGRRSGDCRGGDDVRTGHLHGIDGRVFRLHKDLAFAWHRYVDVGTDLRHCARLRDGDGLHNEVLRYSLIVIQWPPRIV